MDFRILGVVEAGHNGRDIPLGGTRERAVLARLLLSPNRVVAREVLLEDLWGAGLPDGASQALLVYLSRLRKALREHGDGQSLVTRPPGYLIEVEPNALDATRFETLVDQARTEDPSAATATLREALALWRGPALGGVGDAPFARAEAARLDEARLAALEQRIDADLVCGRHGALVGELAGLTGEHPLREQLWAQRMIALYRSGRQAEALRAYQDLRRHLGEELGLEPSDELRRLESAVLRRDPCLNLAGETVAAAPIPELSASPGVIAFLFTDLVGSTELLCELGDDDADELRRMHFKLLRHALAEHRGDEVKSLGDGLMAAFASPLAAIRCAVAIQEAIAQQTPAREGPLAVRVGVHAGEPISDDDDFFGTPVVIAQRLCNRARGGQILASALVQGLVGNRGGFAFKDLGGLALKGLAEPVAACEVAWATSTDAAIPLPLPLERDDESLVGRDAELTRLEAAWEGARAGRRRFMLVGGEPGIGKTRLAAEIARIAQRAGGVVLFGRCNEDLGVPYQPVVEALGTYRRQARPPVLGRLAGELVRLVPDLAEDGADLADPLSSDPETERYRLFDAVAAWLAAVSAGAPVVFVVDDLHWATKPTLALLTHLARSGETLRLLVVATYRDTALDVTSELAEALADLTRQPGVDRLRLTGLDEEGVAAFMATQVGHDLDDPTLALARSLHAETGGNLFFVGQLMGHLRETGALVHRQGRWEARGVVADAGVPEGIREVIIQRLGRLPDATRAALEVGAVIGDHFDLDVLVGALSHPEIATLQALDPAITARLVTGAGTTRPGHRFCHALVRATIYDGLADFQRLDLHQRAGEAIAAVYAGRLDDYLPALAHHFARAGADYRARAALYATRAGDRSTAHLAHDEAATWYALALDLHDAAGGADAARCDLLISLGEAQRRAGHAESRQTLIEAARLADSLGDSRRLARAAVANQPPVFNLFYEPDAERMAVFHAAIDAVGDDDPALRAQLLASLAAEQLFSNKRECDRLVTEALDLARTLDDPITIGHIFTIASFTMIDQRDPITFEQSKRKLASIGGFADPAHEFWWSVACACWAEGSGDWAAAKHLMRVANGLADELGQPTIRWAVALEAAYRLRLRGRLDDAEQAAYEAFELGASTGPGARNASRIYRAQLYTIRFDQGRTGELLDRISQAATRRTPATARVLHCAVLGELEQLEEARRVFDDLATDDFAAVDYPRMPLLALLAPMCATLHEADRAAYLYQTLAPYHAGLARYYINSGEPVAHYLGVLAAELGRYEDAEAHFVEAAGIAETLEAPASLARTRLEWATMLARRGRPEDAARVKALAADALSAAETFGFARVAEQARRLL